MLLLLLGKLVCSLRDSEEVSFHLLCLQEECFLFLILFNLISL